MGLRALYVLQNDLWQYFCIVIERQNSKSGTIYSFKGKLFTLVWKSVCKTCGCVFDSPTIVYTVLCTSYSYFVFQVALLLTKCFFIKWKILKTCLFRRWLFYCLLSHIWNTVSHYGYGVNKSQSDKKISSMPIIFQSNHQTKFSCQPEFKASDKVNSYFLPAIIFVLLSIRDGSIK